MRVREEEVDCEFVDSEARIGRCRDKYVVLHFDAVSHALLCAATYCSPVQPFSTCAGLVGFGGQHYQGLYAKSNSACMPV